MAAYAWPTVPSPSISAGAMTLFLARYSPLSAGLLAVAAVELMKRKATSGVMALLSAIILDTEPSSILARQTGQPGFIHSRTTTLPLKSARLTSLPAESFSVKAGAALPTMAISLAISLAASFLDSFLESCMGAA